MPEEGGGHRRGPEVLGAELARGGILEHVPHSVTRPPWRASCGQLSVSPATPQCAQLTMLVKGGLASTKASRRASTPREQPCWPREAGPVAQTKL